MKRTNFLEDPKLTAYALGELEGDERVEVEAAFHADPAVRAAVEEIRAMAARMEAALAVEVETAAEQMSEARNQKSEHGRTGAEGGSAGAEGRKAAIIPGSDPWKLDGGPLRRDEYGKKAKSKLLRFPQVYFLIGGLAAAGFAVVVALQEPRHAVHEEARRYREVSLTKAREEAPSTAQGVVDPTVAEKKVSGPASPASDFAIPTGLLAQAEKARKEKTAWAGPEVEEQAFAGPAKKAERESKDSIAINRVAMARTEKPQVYVYPRDDKFVIEAQPAPKAAAVAPSAASEPIALSPFEVREANAPRITGLRPSQTFGGTRLHSNLADSSSAISVVKQQFLESGSESEGLGKWSSYFHESPPSGHRLFGMASPRGISEAMNTEAYAYRAENGFLSAAENPQSTFSADVDTASYANVRRFIENGERPPADAVRIEELVNYFPYRYEGPGAARGQRSESGVRSPESGDEGLELRAEGKTGAESKAAGRGEGAAAPLESVPFAASMEVADAPWAAGHRLVRIGLKGREVAASERGPANLVFLLDVSGSMNEPNKLPLVQESMRLLLGRLRPDDRVAIVVYAGASGLALPSTPAAKQREIADAIAELHAGGSTNGAMGIQLAYDIAKANFVSGGINRVILCTDGDFNVGVTSEGELVRLIQEKAKSGVFLTVLGFGMGNYKDATLQQLADAGNGNYGYVDSRREAEKLLVGQVNGTLVTIAKDVKLQVEFNPAQVASYRLIGYEKRMLKKEDFNDDKVDAGEIGAGHTVTALYEIVPAGAAGREGQAAAAVDELKYQRRSRVSASVVWSPAPELTPSKELLTLKVRYKEPAGDVSRRLEFPLTDRGERFADASADFKFAAAVAEFGIILRDSPHKGTATLADVRKWAEAGAGDDPGGYRAEFIGLVEKAERLVL